MSDSFVDIVFDGPPGPECGRFVEVENPDGASIRFGEWVERADGFWALRIKQPPKPPSEVEEALKFLVEWAALMNTTDDTEVSRAERTLRAHIEGLEADVKVFKGCAKYAEYPEFMRVEEAERDRVGMMLKCERVSGDLTAERDALKAERDQLLAILKVAACPDSRCIDGAIPHQTTPDDWEEEQCQFCYCRASHLGEAS